jgi:hypothetical protein
LILYVAPGPALSRRMTIPRNGHSDAPKPGFHGGNNCAGPKHGSPLRPV